MAFKKFKCPGRISHIFREFETSVSDPYSLNPDPDPAENLNPNPDPEGP